MQWIYSLGLSLYIYLQIQVSIPNLILTTTLSFSNLYSLQTMRYDIPCADIISVGPWINFSFQQNPLEFLHVYLKYFVKYPSTTGSTCK